MSIYLPQSQLGALAKKLGNKSKRPTSKQSLSDAYIKLHSRIQRNFIGLPEPDKEVRFHPVRKWRMDYAWPDLKIALEVHGGHHSNGRHVRGAGFAEDRAKMNEAQLLGWLVLEVTTDNIKDLRTWLEKAIELRTL
ncbi:endonuclease domain-containing protein [Aliivibrio fischeri]|uniref:endonuclease domain-containing protein n=1 Tax=Aliivibrio fischeri TaxID=668 RepID=UPI001F27EE07|nr:endonuclease domain-containing protein [Aliivibrio fischeri]MCE7567549.1 endonuclease domain-containing protein [Aliivibrio fischeri]